MGRGGRELRGIFSVHDKKLNYACSMRAEVKQSAWSSIARVLTGGYQVGRFPPGLAEWNDRFRNVARSYWKGDGVAVPDLATRLALSVTPSITKDENPGPVSTSLLHTTASR
jgi:pullulanase/glycogen debranching enzyme